MSYLENTFIYWKQSWETNRLSLSASSSGGYYLCSSLVPCMVSASFSFPPHIFLALDLVHLHILISALLDHGSPRADPCIT